jgi:ABC-type uncharacterized transport system auxiliary subunit
MFHPLRRLKTGLAAAAAIALPLFGSGCGTGAATTATNAATTTVQTANAVVNTAATTAVEVVQATVAQVLNIPQLVFDLATGQVTANGNSNWGKPKMVVVTDTEYVLIYPTPDAELRRNRGVPRMVLIRRNDQTDPTKRL